MVVWRCLKLCQGSFRSRSLHRFTGEWLSEDVWSFARDPADKEWSRSFHRFTGEWLSEDVWSFARGPSDQDFSSFHWRMVVWRCLKLCQGPFRSRLFIVSLENGCRRCLKLCQGSFGSRSFHRFTGEWLSEDVWSFARDPSDKEWSRSFHRFTGEWLSEDVWSFARGPSDHIFSSFHWRMVVWRCLKLCQGSFRSYLFIVSLENGCLKMSEALLGILQIKISSSVHWRMVVWRCLKLCQGSFR